MTNLITILIVVLSVQQQITQVEFENKAKALVESMLSDYKINDTGLKVDSNACGGASWSKRVDLKSKKLFLNKYNQKDYQEYNLMFIYFDTSEQCLDARQNYLDNFSDSGKLTPEVKGVKKWPSFSMINENSIIIFEVSCEGHRMDDKWSWERIKSELVSSFGTVDSELIENGCGFPITWQNNKN